jgi:translation elongation factor EF-1beta
MTKKPMTEAELEKFASDVEVELEKLYEQITTLLNQLIEIIAPEDDEVAFSAVWRLAMTLVYTKFGEGASDAMIEVLRGFAPKNDNEDATYWNVLFEKGYDEPRKF